MQSVVGDGARNRVEGRTSVLENLDRAQSTMQ